MTDTKPLGRSYRSGISLSYGMFTVQGSLYAPKESNATVSLVSLCPTCGRDDPTKIHERNDCPNGHGPFTRDELTLKGVMEGRGKTAVPRCVGTKEEINALKKSEVPASTFDFQIHYADEVESATFPGGTAYVFVPAKAGEFDAVLREIVGHDGRMPVGERARCLLSEVNLDDSVKLFQLRVWRGNILLQELIRPTELKSFPVVESSCSERNRDLLLRAFEQDTQAFDASSYSSKVNDRLAEFVAKRLAGETFEIETVEPAAPAQTDPFAALAATLDSPKPKSSRKAA